MPRYGKNAVLEAKLPASGSWIELSDTATTNHGLSDLAYTPTAEPIARPAKDDMRYEAAAQTARSVTFSIESDDTTDPLFEDRAGQRIDIRISPKGKASGDTRITATNAVLAGDITMNMAIDALMRYTVTANFDGAPTRDTW